jgi:multidrug efflux pump subunit AcrB
MNPVVFALRHPYTVMVAALTLALCALLGLGNLFPDWLVEKLPVRAMPVDIFPDLNTPVIYVAQPYGGMDPGQMEGFLTNYFEYHFLYITGIHHVESKNIQGMALMKLYFHPGTNMAQAMAETVAYVNRSRSFMPPGTVPPFVMRFDAGSVPVGYLVFSSETRSIAEVQDAALFKVRPMFASLPGVSAPPPFGGNQRTVVVHVRPDRLSATGLSPDDVVAALAANNQISPSGNVRSGDLMPMVPVNSVVTNIKELEGIVLRRNGAKAVYLRDVARVEDSTDIATCYGLVNGRRSVYILVTKRSDASTVNVVRAVKAKLPDMQKLLPSGVQVSFEFDQSPYVTRSLLSVIWEAGLGAALTGLMVLLFLRDWRSVLVVVLNIPLALLGAILALWLTGETINLMTLGGLALAVGILVDEATVEVENIHTQMGRTPSIAHAVRLGNAETAVPRLLAMLCILAVFVPMFFMRGAAQALFRPLALAVGFAMVTSYLLSSTFVPVLSVWLLRHTAPGHGKEDMAGSKAVFGGLLRGCLHLRWLFLLLYLGGIAAFGLWGKNGHPGLGTELFPAVDAGQFQMRLRAPDGSSLEKTEELAKRVLDEIAQISGKDKLDMTVTLVGNASYNYPINSIYLWSAGPHEAILKVALKHGSGVSIEALKDQLRARLPQLAELQGARIAFEAGDIVEDVMSFGAPAKIEVAVSGPSLPDNRLYAEKVFARLTEIPSLVDLQYGQGMDYPTIDVVINRERAGLMEVTATEVGRALAPYTLSSRFTTALYWRDPKSGIGYQVQVQVAPGPNRGMVDEASLVQKLKMLVVKKLPDKEVLLGDVAEVTPGKMPAQVDRYNMRRLVSITANIRGEDLGRVADRVHAALAQAKEDARQTYGDKFAAVQVDVRGQLVPMEQVFTGLTWGLGVAVLAILLLLTANFQSLRMAFIVVSTIPAVLGGVALSLCLTHTTLNLQSFMGTIMAVGVAVANAILLVTFAERRRREGADAITAALEGAQHRLRPILMTSCAMIAGMIPMAFPQILHAVGVSEGGEHTAALGRAVIGGLLAATIATLFFLPCVFSLLQSGASRVSPSLDPEDPESRFHPTEVTSYGPMSKSC